MTFFELLAELQKWKSIEEDLAREVDERPQYFALRLQKSVIEFYRTLPQATRENYDECVKVFREHYFPGTAISPLTTRRKTDRFLADLKQFSLNAYITELQDKSPTGS